MMTTLSKKTNYSKNKTIESETEMSTFSYELVSAWMVAVETRTQTELLGWFFLLKQPINTPKTYPKKLATRGIATFLGWVHYVTNSTPVLNWSRHFSPNGNTQEVPNRDILGMRMGRNGRMERSFFDQTGPNGESGPPQKADQFFRNFSCWTEPIHWVLDRNFRKFWFNGSRPVKTRI